MHHYAGEDEERPARPPVPEAAAERDLSGECARADHQRAGVEKRSFRNAAHVVWTVLSIGIRRDDRIGIGHVLEDPGETRLERRALPAVALVNEQLSELRTRALERLGALRGAVVYGDHAEAG